ncbi:MAG: hypothetical protein JW940_14025 [Polyangiaceae bacterium]|nr:hypothetical protein [Polyangiaceae bacterium]
MAELRRPKPGNERVAEIVRDAGGKIVGRTRLQKITYLLQLAGLEQDFGFEYRHYGPYSDGLALAVQDAQLLGLLTEDEHEAAWGGVYSIYRTKDPSTSKPSSARARLLREVVDASSIELELAATAAYFAEHGFADPWAETAVRKPDKAQEGRLERARELLGRLSRIETPRPLPSIT